jgi:hypothetical protein
VCAGRGEGLHTGGINAEPTVKSNPVLVLSPDLLAKYANAAELTMKSATKSLFLGLNAYQYGTATESEAFVKTM